jgi:hypothetical protein
MRLKELSIELSDKIVSSHQNISVALNVSKNRVEEVRNHQD